MKLPTRRQSYMGVAAVLALSLFGAWWYSHDPFRGVDRHATYDQTAYYKPSKGLFTTPRRKRTMFLKDIGVEQVYKLVKDLYPEKQGWIWNTDNMPESFAAMRTNRFDRAPESVAGVLTSEGTVQVVEFRIVPKSEEQVVLRTRGSDAFVPYPVMQRMRPRGENENPRFLNAG